MKNAYWRRGDGEDGDICLLETLPPHHRDPFDRLMIAQSLARKLTLVTPDPLMRLYDVEVYWE